MYISGKIASVGKMRIFYDTKPNETGGNGENISETKNKPLSLEELQKIQEAQKRSAQAHEKTETDHMKNDVPEAQKILADNGMNGEIDIDLDALSNEKQTQIDIPKDTPEVPISPEDQKIIDASIQNASAEFADETVYKQIIENGYKINAEPLNDGRRIALKAESVVILLVADEAHKKPSDTTKQDYLNVLKNPGNIVAKLKTIGISEMDGKKLIDLAVTREKFGNTPKQMIADTKEEEKKPRDFLNLGPEGKKLVSMIDTIRKNPAFSNDQKQQDQFENMLDLISQKSPRVSYQVQQLKIEMLTKIDPEYRSKIDQNTSVSFPGILDDDVFISKIFSLSESDRQIFSGLSAILKQGEKAADENAVHNDQVAIAEYRVQETKKDEYIKQQTQNQQSIEPAVVKTLLESPASERLSYGSDLTALPPGEPKVMQLASGPIIVLKNSDGTISAHDPNMNVNNGLINIGPAEDFKDNIRVLNIGRNYPILQSLFATGDLALIQKHMRYIETSLQRNGLTTREYTTYLLSSLIELSGTDKTGSIKPTFNKANFDKVELYFSEHQHDIQAGLLQKGLLNDQMVLNRNTFLNSLSDPKKTL